MSARVYRFLFIVMLIAGAGCANITAPTGGKRDKTPPKLLEADPKDSLLNTRPSRLVLRFDEYVTVSDVTKELQISPILAIQPSAVALNKHVTVKIMDTLLEPNTTYRLTFGNAIKDVHEGNPFTKYTYTFSTGAYFDSLELKGIVINAVTGLPDSNGMSVELYSAKDDDTAISRKKPKYVTKVGPNGKFVFKGLPKRSFRIYGIKDVNGNMLYDGPVPGEWIGYNEQAVLPGDTLPITLHVFPETADTGQKKSMDSLAATKKTRMGDSKTKTNKKDSLFTYTVNITDTGNLGKRIFDVKSFVKISFNKIPVLNRDKIKLTIDSADNTTTPDITLEIDSMHPKDLYIKTEWEENTVYTLRLAKGFAKDTAGKEAAPSKYIFRTMDDDDYSKMRINLPGKYNSKRYLLLVASDKDTVWYKPVTDTIVKLRQIKPGKYTFRIIVDENGNGMWDTGDLLAHKQPEEVITGPEPLDAKPGFEYITDFEQKPKPKSKGMKDKAGGK